MTDAARLDSIARRENRPAQHKLKMLPEVVSLLNRNQYVNSLVDPEINLLEAVKFFLEPLDDGSLPAYDIQRDLFAALAKLPITKDALIASGIGKVIVFYTKSKRPQIGIKRQAERLLAEWTRPILQKSDDYSKRVYEEVDFDPRYVYGLLCRIYLEILVFILTPLSCTANLPSAIDRYRPKQLLLRLVQESCFHPVWRIGRVPKEAILRILSCLVLPACRRANLRAHLVRAARTVSDV